MLLRVPVKKWSNNNRTAKTKRKPEDPESLCQHTKNGQSHNTTNLQLNEAEFSNFFFIHFYQSIFITLMDTEKNNVCLNPGNVIAIVDEFHRSRAQTLFLFLGMIYTLCSCNINVFSLFLLLLQADENCSFCFTIVSSVELRSIFKWLIF